MDSFVNMPETIVPPKGQAKWEQNVTGSKQNKV